ncbi:hypothetical protein TrVFT333_001162 [Trichoderma virens FT-333]|nr:hypothetical protein TrVFT333_001162 [Trichoderma virens FT-333]
MDGSSPDHAHRHLDANAGREVVYCHACASEWYRDERGLLCPRCGSDITEIVSLENDPRAFDDDSEPESPRLPQLRHRFPHGDHDHDDHDHNHGNDHDSDPDEADIEEHLGPNGFHWRRSVRDRPGMQHHDPAVDPVIERFLGLIQDIAPQRRTNLFEQRSEEGRYGAPHIHRATFTNGSGSASVTIFSGSGPGLFGPTSPGQDRHPDPFQAFFSNVLRDVSPPTGGREAGGPTPGFARGLQEILNLFNPAHAIAGDAVYSQEALDQIITNLMEAHPQSNAAPPASTEALDSLDRRPVDASMLEGEKTECTICIDDMKVDDVAAFLPCKHWFHEECVTLWLKQHNTCPVCRASIEKPDERSGPSMRTSPPPISSQSSDFGSSRSDDLYGIGMSRTEPVPIPGAGPSRPPNQGQSRINEAMRDLSAQQQERQDREHMRQRIWGMPGDRGERQQEHDTRERERSDLGRSICHELRYLAPPQSGRRDRENAGSSSGANANASASPNPGQQTSSGPFSWLRDRFTGGGSRDDSNRE